MIFHVDFPCGYPTRISGSIFLQSHMEQNPWVWSTWSNIEPLCLNASPKVHFSGRPQRLGPAAAGGVLEHKNTCHWEKAPWKTVEHVSFFWARRNGNFIWFGAIKMESCRRNGWDLSKKTHEFLAFRRGWFNHENRESIWISWHHRLVIEPTRTVHQSSNIVI